MAQLDLVDSLIYSCQLPTPYLIWMRFLFLPGTILKIARRQVKPQVPMEFFLNRSELTFNSANSGSLKITEARIWLNLKILSLHVSCRCYGSILASDTRGRCFSSSSRFIIMADIFVTEFSELRETFRKNSIVLGYIVCVE